MSTLITIKDADNLPTKTPIGLSALALIGLTQAGAFLGVAGNWMWLFTVSAVLGVLVDIVTYQLRAIRVLLGSAHIGLVSRSLVRDLGLVILLVQNAQTAPVSIFWLCLAGFSVPVLRGALLFLDTPLERRFRRAVITLGLEVHEPRPHARPVPIPEPTAAILVGVIPLVGGCLSLLTGSWPVFFATVAAYLLGLGAWLGLALIALVRSRRVAPRAAHLAVVNRALTDWRPEAAIYFSGPPTATYQLQMWLSVMENIGRRVVVILREPAHLPNVGATTLPVICIPQAPDLMTFRFPTVRVAFYPAHVGKNIHLQREPRMKHVFIGHGESDKTASVNPITKGFDEVWVAGRASRERWRAARVGVRDQAIVEVGRPQLGGIVPASGDRSGRPLSVLYAPTWEGWTGDPAASSVPSMGSALIRWLLNRPDTRVIYRPHPFIGTVADSARKAHEAVISAIRADPRAGTLPDQPSEEDWRKTVDRHLVISGSATTLYECFNNADVLIGDISSVVPDFLASEKPLLVTNPSAVGHETIRAELASTRAAALLDPDPSGWEEALSDAEGPDTWAEQRRALRLELLGPHHDDPVEPWRAALADLIERAEREWPDAAAEASAPMDG